MATTMKVRFPGLGAYVGGRTRRAVGVKHTTALDKVARLFASNLDSEEQVRAAILESSGYVFRAVRSEKDAGSWPAFARLFAKYQVVFVQWAMGEGDFFNLSHQEVTRTVRSFLGEAFGVIHSHECAGGAWSEPSKQPHTKTAPPGAL